MDWKILIAAISTFLVVFIAYIVWEVNHFVVTHYTIRIPKDTLKKKHTMLLIADLHNRQYGKENCRLLEQIKRQKPEYILGAGDFVVSAKGSDTKQAERFLQEIVKICPVYYAMGNHERKMYEHPEWFSSSFVQYEEFMKAIGVHVLRNQSEIIQLDECSVEIAGLDMEREYYKKLQKVTLPPDYMEATMGNRREDAQYHILLAHNPEFFKEYAKWGADLVCAGHVHGGIARLPFVGGVIAPSLKLFPKYDGGVFKEYDSEMILSRGLGTHTLPVRFANPPELVVLHFEGEN